ncbi:MAG: hypothetical protein DRG87_09385, partial [Deltaproteobacteria bacterium]
MEFWSSVNLVRFAHNWNIGNWNDGIMPACRQTGVLKKMGQWFIGKISLDREVNKWIIAFK